MALSTPLVACGGEDFEQRRADALAAQQRLYEGELLYRPPTEVEKIERLVEHIRRTEGIFIRRDREMTPGLAAAWMERRYFTRWGRQIKDASQFVGIVSERPMWSSRPFVHRSPAGEEILVRDLLFAELERLEEAPDRVVERVLESEPEPAIRESGKAPAHPIEQTISRIEAAPPSVSFVIVDRDGVRTALAGAEMSKKLRAKTKWLGADIDDVDEWMREIGTRDYMSYLPYEVEIDGAPAGQLPDWIESPTVSDVPGAEETP